MSWLTEIRFALRRLGRRPALSVLAVALLAVGLGGNLALLSTLDAILFRQPPVVEPERLVRVLRTDSGHNFADNWSYPNADDLRRGATTIADAAIYADWRGVSLKVAGEDGAIVRSGVVTGNYFEMLGARAAMGRLLTPADDRAEDPAPVAVIAHDVWRTRFAADPGVVGSEIGLNGRTFIVVGVAPKGLRSLDPTLAPEVWVPIHSWTALLTDEGRRDLLTQRGSSWLDLLARLAPGATAEAAQAELDARIAALAREFPDLLMVENATGTQPARAWVMPVDEARLGGPTEVPRVSRQATVVGAVGVVVLLVIALNLAAILAARSGQLRHETAVRSALGASRARLAQPLMTEGILLASAGAALAVPIADALAGFARHSLGFVLPLAVDSQLGMFSSPRLALASAALLATVVLLVGALPGLLASRIALLPALRREEVTGAGSRLVAADLLVGAQAALSVVLLLIAGVLVARFRDLSSVDPRFEPTGVVQAAYDLGLQGYSAERSARFHDEVLRRAQEALGEGQVALTDWTPLAGGWSRTSITPSGYEARQGEIPNADISWVSPELFDVLRIPLRRGRGLSPADSAETPPVAVVNAEMARRYFPDRDPLGASFQVGYRTPEAQWITVVGVVDDVRHRDLHNPVPPMFFRPLAQRQASPTRLVVVARTEPAPAALSALRAVLRELDPELPLFRTGRLTDQVAASLDDERRAASLFGGFAALVLVLAAAGLGALALASVARRRREIGVRVALGATKPSVLALLVRRTAWIVAGGCATGLGLAALVVPRVGELAGAAVELAPARIVSALALLLCAALVATWLPARRALRIDPAEVLRSE